MEKRRDRIAELRQQGQDIIDIGEGWFAFPSDEEPRSRTERDDGASDHAAASRPRTKKEFRIMIIPTSTSRSRRYLKKPCCQLLAATVLLVSPATAASVTGHVRVIDGDTIVILESNVHVRLNGIDAPEVAHPHHPADDPLGPASRNAMRQIVGEQVVTCELNGEHSHERLVGICFLPDGTDIGAEIIRRGLALDCARFSGSRYRSLEAPARG